MSTEILRTESIKENESTSSGQFLENTIKVVLKNALKHDGLICGINQVVKAIEASSNKNPVYVRVCFLASSCDNVEYKKLVTALCFEKKIPLIEVPSRKNLGNWSGLCSIDLDGLARRVVGTSCVAITDYGEESEEMNNLKNYINEINGSA